MDRFGLAMGQLSLSSLWLKQIKFPQPLTNNLGALVFSLELAQKLENLISVFTSRAIIANQSHTLLILIKAWKAFVDTKKCFILIISLR